LLAPFWAAAAFFGLRYLEERRTADACALGLAAGFGAVTKYEIAFILGALIAAAAFIPRYRRVFAAPASYLSVAIAALIFAPHVWWLATHNWASLARAVGVEKMHDVASTSLSLGQAASGQVALFGAPVLALAVCAWRGVRSGGPSRDSGAQAGWVLIFAPSAILLAGALATDQVIKPLWALPLASSAAVGLALVWPADEDQDLRWFALAAIGASALILAGFFAYLFLADAIGKPITAFEPDARALALAVERQWRLRQPGDLDCLVVADRKLGPSPVLWLRPMPHVVDYSSGFWHGPQKVAHCLQTGGMIVDASPEHTAQRQFPRSCPADSLRFDVPSRFGLKGGFWPIELIYVPPAGQGC
jgi:hypothetical protein